MKNKLMFLIIGCGALLFSCSTTPVITNKGSFIVSYIEKYNDDLCLYIASNPHSRVSGTVRASSIILPKGMFNVGDTIKSNNLKK